MFYMVAVINKHIHIFDEAMVARKLDIYNYVSCLCNRKNFSCIDLSSENHGVVFLAHGLG
jgi:hypothetical protein